MNVSCNGLLVGYVGCVHDAGRSKKSQKNDWRKRNPWEFTPKEQGEGKP